MDLLSVSSLYHAGGTMLLVRLAYLVVVLLSVMAAGRWLRRRWATAGRIVRRSVAVLGMLVSAWLAVVELWLFRARCPLCLLATTALVAGFALGWRTPDRRTWGAVAVLCVGGLGFLFPFGTIPKVYAVTEPAPALDGYSVLRQKGSQGVVVQEFADFQCRACAQMDRTLERLLESDPEGILLVYRHLPLTSVHPWAEPAAFASECAAWQGRFWEAKRDLFRSQRELGVVVEDLESRSWEIPDAEIFRSCVEGGHAEPAIQEDVAEARRLGIRSTPSVLVGQVLVVGSTPISRLEAVVEAVRSGRMAGPAIDGPPGPAGEPCGESASTTCSEAAPGAGI